MDIGWNKKSVMSPEQVVKNKQSALDMHSQKIAELKSEYLELQEKFNNLKKFIDDAVALRVEEIAQKQSELDAKIIEADNARIEARNILEENKEKSEAIHIAMQVFQESAEETGRTFDATRAALQKQEDEYNLRLEDLAHRENIANEVINKSQEINKEIESKLESLRKQEIAIKELQDKTDAGYKQMLEEKIKHEEDLIATRRAKQEYEEANQSIVSEKLSLATIKKDYEDKLNNLNNNILKLREAQTQLKLDRIEVENRIKDALVAEKRAKDEQSKLATQKDMLSNSLSVN